MRDLWIVATVIGIEKDAIAISLQTLRFSLKESALALKQRAFVSGSFSRHCRLQSYQEHTGQMVKQCDLNFQALILFKLAISSTIIKLR